MVYVVCGFGGTCIHMYGNQKSTSGISLNCVCGVYWRVGKSVFSVSPIAFHLSFKVGLLLSLTPPTRLG